MKREWDVKKAWLEQKAAIRGTEVNMAELVGMHYRSTLMTC